MESVLVLAISDWPEKIGTNWYAIGGTFGILLAVLIALAVLAHIRFPEYGPEDDTNA